MVMDIAVVEPRYRLNVTWTGCQDPKDPPPGTCGT